MSTSVVLRGNQYGLGSWESYRRLRRRRWHVQQRLAIRRVENVCRLISKCTEGLCGGGGDEGGGVMGAWRWTEGGGMRPAAVACHVIVTTSSLCGAVTSAVTPHRAVHPHRGRRPPTDSEIGADAGRLPWRLTAVISKVTICISRWMCDDKFAVVEKFQNVLFIQK